MSGNRKGEIMITGRKRVRLYRVLGVAILAVFALMYSLSKVGMSGNETSRFATVQAVAEQNTFAIEKTVFGTVDKVKKKSGGGHTYSDKPPFLSFAVGVELKPVRLLTGWNLREHAVKLVYLVDILVGGADDGAPSHDALYIFFSERDRPTALVAVGDEHLA